MKRPSKDTAVVGGICVLAYFCLCVAGGFGVKVESPQAHAQPVSTEKAPAVQTKQYSAEDYWRPWDAWLKAKGSPISGQDVWTASQETRIKGEVLICITGAETNFGKVAQRGSRTNVGSVGSWDATNTTFHAPSVLDGLRMIGKTLNNNLLGKKTAIGQLSRKSEPYGPVYAESTENWERNVLSCLTEMTGQPQNNQFQFRL